MRIIPCETICHTTIYDDVDVFVNNLSTALSSYIRARGGRDYCPGDSPLLYQNSPLVPHGLVLTTRCSCNDRLVVYVLLLLFTREVPGNIKK